MDAPELEEEYYVDNHHHRHLRRRVRARMKRQGVFLRPDFDAIEDMFDARNADSHVQMMLAREAVERAALEERERLRVERELAQAEAERLRQEAMEWGSTSSEESRGY